MSERQPPAASRSIEPKDVFQRTNMPSRWERITSVSPKTALDRKYLAFVAARYRGDERLPHPDELAVPAEVAARRWTRLAGWTGVAIGAVTGAVGVNTHLAVLVVIAGVFLACALATMTLAWQLTEPAIRRYQELRTRCERAEKLLRSNPIDPKDAEIINQMIVCDEGTMTYCAAKIASEIEHDPVWKSSNIGFVPIDIWQELIEISASARQITDDRRTTESLERGRLRDDPEVSAAIDDDKQHRREAITLLAARVHAFADYRDRVHRHGMVDRRERSVVSRTIRQLSDEQARDRLL